MRLVSFNTGIVRPQIIDGEIVHTAHVKAPVAQPWIITPSGAAGDQVAVHSDHLYAFDRASYDHWAQELGVARQSWPDGHFAENLTLDTLDQAQLRVGDHYRIGAATIVVTGPRVPCWKLTWRLGQPKSFTRRFRLSGRSGAYFGVIRPGRVRPDDRLILISRDDDAPTVAELSRLCDSGTRITAYERTVIDRALASNHLSATVRGTLDLKVAALDRDGGASAPGWPGWRPFEIGRVVHETADTASFHLRPADGGSLPGFRAGQHVVARLNEPGGKPIVRTWSLSSYTSEPGTYRITVRRRPGGRGAAALSLAADRGLTVDLRAPSGHFHLDRGTFRPVVLVAAGVGITPMIAMVEAHLERGAGMPPLWLLYGSRSPEETAFRGYLGKMFARHQDLHLHHFHSGAGRRITAERVVEVMRGNYLRIPGGTAGIPWFESDIYLCGPLAFNTAVRDGLVAAGANPDLVRVEDFGAAPVLPSRQADAVVRYAPSGVEATWASKDERTLLELAEDNGLEPPYDCRAGTCRTCESRLTCGDVDGPVTEAGDGTRRVLLCVSYPRSDRVVVEDEPADLTRVADARRGTGTPGRSAP